MALDCVIRLHRMHEMQTIVTDVRGVCLSVCPSVTRRVQCVRGLSVQPLPNYFELLLLFATGSQFMYDVATAFASQWSRSRFSCCVCVEGTQTHTTDGWLMYGAAGKRAATVNNNLLLSPCRTSASKPEICKSRFMRTLCQLFMRCWRCRVAHLPPTL